MPSTYYNLDPDENGELVESSADEMRTWLDEYLANGNSDPDTIKDVEDFIKRKKGDSR